MQRLPSLPSGAQVSNLRFHQQTSEEDSVPGSANALSKVFYVPILGGSGCGKTSLVQRLVYSSERYPSTLCHRMREAAQQGLATHHYPLILSNEKVYQTHFIDCPVFGDFPSNSVQEWFEYRDYYLNVAHAYVILFDISSTESFHYAKVLRDQIVHYKPQRPILLVANKVDLLIPFTINGAPFGPLMWMQSKQRAELSNAVRKQWRGTHLVECSTKYDWHVQNVLLELLRLLDVQQASHRSASTRGVVQGMFFRNRCILM